MLLRIRKDDLKPVVLPGFAATTALFLVWGLRRSAWSRHIALDLEGRDLDLETQSEYSDPERRLFGMEIVTLVRSAISKLSRRRRQVAQCFLFDELSIEEIAVCLGISKRAVSTHLCNAKQEIAIALRAAGYAIRGSGT
jgi:RNA polymerase sigma factor (sigma-70 family)